MSLSIRLPVVTVAVLAAACASTGAGDYAVTPQRPTFSNDTSTTAPGTFEVELGYFQTEDDKLLGFTTTSKYGYDDKTELFVTWAPYLEIPRADASDPGDAVLGVRHRFEEEYELPELAWELSLLIPSNNNETQFSNGELGILVAGIATGHYEETTWTGYLQLGVLGDENASAKLRQAVAVAGSIDYNDEWGGFAEVAYVNQTAGDPDPFFAVLGFDWMLDKSRVFDFGVEVPINNDADWRYFVGMTWNLGRLLAGESTPVFPEP